MYINEENNLINKIEEHLSGFGALITHEQSTYLCSMQATYNNTLTSSFYINFSFITFVNLIHFPNHIAFDKQLKHILFEQIENKVPFN